MPDNKLIKMIGLLQRRTDEQKISWEQAVDEDVYQTAFPNYTVQLGYKESSTQFGDIDYFIRILDEDNKIVEEATDVDLHNELVNEDMNTYKVMENLYKSARRQAMGVDKAINSILSELENGD
jgi:hypothetical protein